MQRNRKAFTLIELLIVVVIIGILAAIAIPKFASTKEKAYVTAMRSDLRNMMTAQESYFSDYGLYTTQTGNLKGFSQTTGVHVVLGEASGGGWWASATHNALTSTQTCELAVGASASTGGRNLNEGEPTCH
jgi:prepilin-type N-terminal cleavage/methylation domain-containing protein